MIFLQDAVRGSVARQARLYHPCRVFPTECHWLMRRSWPPSGPHLPCHLQNSPSRHPPDLVVLSYVGGRSDCIAHQDRRTGAQLVYLTVVRLATRQRGLPMTRGAFLARRPTGSRQRLFSHSPQCCFLDGIEVAYYIGTGPLLRRHSLRSRRQDLMVGVGFRVRPCESSAVEEIGPLDAERPRIFVAVIAHNMYVCTSGAAQVRAHFLSLCLVENLRVCAD